MKITFGEFKSAPKPLTLDEVASSFDRRFLRDLEFSQSDISSPQTLAHETIKWLCRDFPRTNFAIYGLDKTFTLQLACHGGSAAGKELAAIHILSQKVARKLQKREATSFTLPEIRSNSAEELGGHSLFAKALSVNGRFVGVVVTFGKRQIAPVEEAAVRRVATSFFKKMVELAQQPRDGALPLINGDIRHVRPARHLATN